MEILSLTDVNRNMVSLVGGKNASLGEMINFLTSHGVNVPPGFVITTIGYSHFLEYNHLDFTSILDSIDYTNLENLHHNALKIRTLIQNSSFPPDLESKIRENYIDEPVAVRSSSTAEDLPEASFAGQQDTYLNVEGIENVLESIKNCFASLYTDRAINYRASVKYSGTVSISVAVQKMVPSYCSGVAFSIDPDSGFNNVIVINASWGLGELIVQGEVTPDEFIVFKPTHAIIDKKLGTKTHRLVYDSITRVKKLEVAPEDQNKFCLSEKEVLQLATWVQLIENHYGFNVDIEWALNENRELFILQARPETIHSRPSPYLTQYQIEKSSDIIPILSGIAIGDNIGIGRVRIMNSIDDPFTPGDILVTQMTSPDWEPIMMQAKAIITDRGGRTCHSAIIAREMGIVAIVGTGKGTQILHPNQLITVSCCEGEVGYIYDGEIPYHHQQIDLNSLPTLKTKIMLNIASPNDVFKYFKYPVTGVGLVREEFIINNYIQAHPLALINYSRLDTKYKDRIDTLIRGYESPTHFYINKLAYGLARIAATFYPQDVIIRFSDFKSNEYRDLFGGDLYEPEESNPMIGYRGCSRYYSQDFREAFGLECLAIKKLREEMGLKNVIVMFPFCRSVEECVKVQNVMEEYGLKRGVDGLQISLMAELPVNVILCDEFSEHVDLYSIGSNDLTQLILGLDRDSNLVAHLYDERNPAILKALSKLIRKAKRKGKKIGICGNGPSVYPDFAQFLVGEGIDSISITPDAIVKTFLAIAEIEKKTERIFEYR